MCLIAGSPVAPFKAFIKGMTNPTLVPAICSAMGFAAVVTASKCDLHLVKALATPPAQPRCIAHPRVHHHHVSD